MIGQIDEHSRPVRGTQLREEGAQGIRIAGAISHLRGECTRREHAQLRTLPECAIEKMDQPIEECSRFIKFPRCKQYLELCDEVRPPLDRRLIRCLNGVHEAIASVQRCGKSLVMGMEGC